MRGGHRNKSGSPQESWQRTYSPAHLPLDSVLHDMESVLALVTDWVCSVWAAFRRDKVSKLQCSTALQRRSALTFGQRFGGCPNRRCASAANRPNRASVIRTANVLILATFRKIKIRILEAVLQPIIKSAQQWHAIHGHLFMHGLSRKIA